jgi:hypothetical protein
MDSVGYGEFGGSGGLTTFRHTGGFLPFFRQLLQQRRGAVDVRPPPREFS